MFLLPNNGLTLGCGLRAMLLVITPLDCILSCVLDLVSPSCLEALSEL